MLLEQLLGSDCVQRLVVGTYFSLSGTPHNSHEELALDSLIPHRPVLDFLTPEPSVESEEAAMVTDYQPVEFDHWLWPRSEQESAGLFVQFHFRSEPAEPPGTRGCADTRGGTRLGTFCKQLDRPGAGGTSKNGVPTWDSCMPARQGKKWKKKKKYLIF